MKKSYSVWFAGTLNKYQIYASSRKEAIQLFAKNLGVQVSGYIQARITQKGEYLLLENGVYGHFDS